MFDLYGPLLSKALFPAFEALRRRPTVSLQRELEASQWWDVAQLRDRQARDLRTLIRHAYDHTEHYRDLLDERGLRASELDSLDALAKLPVLDRTTARASLETRTSLVPPVTVRKTTSGTSGQPLTVKYGALSRNWREATKLRGYGWSGYAIGKRAFHYWGQAPSAPAWLHDTKVSLDRWLKRDRYVDCTPRSDAALAAAVEAFIEHRPHVMIAYAAGAAALARHVVEYGLRVWSDVPVLACAERLWPHDRDVIERAFGPAFETYGCREVMLIGSECEHHDGLHVSMENLIVELLVRSPDGSIRRARPGETGEVAVTDLHNLSCPMIRYLTGDLAIARHGDERCRCGRGLERIGPIDGRVTHALRDHDGRPVSGLVFNVLFATIGEHAREFQIVQHRDTSLTLKLALATESFPGSIESTIRSYVAQYFPRTSFSIEVVSSIALSRNGKREIVVIE